MSSRVLLSALPALLGALLLQATPASAQVGTTDLTCSGGAYQTWEPGLRLSNRRVTATNYTSYDTCTSNDTLVTSGVLVATTELSTSCGGNLGPSETTVTWDDGSVSTFALKGAGVDVINGARVFVSVGLVTGGRFQGDAVMMTQAMSPLDLTPCLYPSGLTALSGPSTLRLTRLF
ncbi:hypothetical protein HUA74_16315 [Myxococcus sp. CA051A]|uniref:Lipoprotein n=1 Tax=Myxococcus llanfairpwllgwyngyllgogerychwyrndrobwllllantysiliogogogochensis TaxID=2590453 RepID=A0A540X361_9BACT|nr:MULTISPECIES: hypothetical protein [Myxococcus]NTX03593.1 hypothetical protein [Myxococcus sp. CA040A]NTX52003.1 hypothetical protein [Myxococcus sp. CA039A]NTX62225.1 hypothetical protein [Myxococcus sp. CA051A]TQF15695.1 hypothetical protein FJV41_12485 [Myxococcus llanfairpwllgwyngyllgogerychwyrndrobwllllantysiliogogogochensis]